MQCLLFMCSSRVGRVLCYSDLVGRKCVSHIVFVISVWYRVCASPTVFVISVWYRVCASPTEFVISVWYWLGSVVCYTHSVCYFCSVVGGDGSVPV